MKRFWQRPALVLFLFIGITVGNAFPYAMGFDNLVNQKFTCYCCDHGKFKCAHCQQMGHRFGHQERNDVVAHDMIFQVRSCGSAQNDSIIRFVTDPFLIVEDHQVFSLMFQWNVESERIHYEIPYYRLQKPPPRIFTAII